MNYHLKYRPKSFDEVMGNTDIVQALEGMLSAREEVPHAFLLHGPTGCGKTTMGRILASELGAKGSDFREVDSADFRGIDTIRDMRKQSQYKPLESPCRVWLLDECHKLSNDAQNALLKALEDPPPHIYYVLCTTEPQKLIPTIRGRCTQFQVSTLSDIEMKKLLRRVVKAENENLDKKVYDQIVQDSLGHPRNALQILNQVLAVDAEKRLKVATKSAELQSQTIELCRALLQGAPWKKIALILKGLKDQDAEGIRRAVLGYTQSVLLNNNRDDKAASILEEFLEPFYDTGFPGLVFACYSVIFGGD